MAIKLFDSTGESLDFSINDSAILIRNLNSDLDPRVSSCLHCNSCVVALDPFEKLIDSLDVFDSDVNDAIFEFIENAGTVHIYIWEENDCAHTLWLDPLFSEWSNATGEKRIRHQS